MWEIIECVSLRCVERLFQLATIQSTHHHKMNTVADSLSQWSVGLGRTSRCFMALRSHRFGFYTVLHVCACMFVCCRTHTMVHIHSRAHIHFVSNDLLRHLYKAFHVFVRVSGLFYTRWTLANTYSIAFKFRLLVPVFRYICIGLYSCLSVCLTHFSSCRVLPVVAK